MSFLCILLTLSCRMSFVLMKISLSDFFFSSWILLFMSYLRTNLRSQKMFPMFSSKNYSFMFYIYVDLDLVSFYTGEKFSLRFIYLLMSSSNTVEKVILSLLLPFHLCQESTGHTVCVCFWTLCSIDLCVHPFITTILS